MLLKQVQDNQRHVIRMLAKVLDGSGVVELHEVLSNSGGVRLLRGDGCERLGLGHRILVGPVVPHAVSGNDDTGRTVITSFGLPKIHVCHIGRGADAVGLEMEIAKRSREGKRVLVARVRRGGDERRPLASHVLVVGAHVGDLQAARCLAEDGVAHGLGVVEGVVHEEQLGDVGASVRAGPELAYSLELGRLLRGVVHRQWDGVPAGTTAGE
mmetsp:Transcript_27620/g.88830  ORF Transcript_27620/g.88830 Transcript_27620/m.88830 type:complete len:212 (+) Transcript_27620:58-693(+)